MKVSMAMLRESLNLFIADIGCVPSLIRISPAALECLLDENPDSRRRENPSYDLIIWGIKTKTAQLLPEVPWVFSKEQTNVTR